MVEAFARDTQSSFGMTMRALDEDGFLRLSDDEIDQIMLCCKPMATDV